MARVDSLLSGADVELECRVLTGNERLGDADTFELTLLSQTPIELDAVLRKPCAIHIVDDSDERLIGSVVTRLSAIATTPQPSVRRCTASVRSSFAVLDLRRQTKVFQHKTVPDIIKAVLSLGLYAADKITVTTSGTHEPREYVVQYAETDAAFVRRLCEDEGLYFRFETTAEGERFVLEDTSQGAARRRPRCSPCSTTLSTRACNKPSTAASPGVAGPAR